MSDTNEREEFEKWYSVSAFDFVENPIGSRDCGLQWRAWQARGELEAKKLEASDARYQARVRELEEALHSISSVVGDYLLFNAKPTDLSKEYHASQQALSTTPDTALQRKVLEARIEIVEMIFEERINSSNFDTLGYYLNQILQELRAQLAALNRNETLGE